MTVCNPTKASIAYGNRGFTTSSQSLLCKKNISPRNESAEKCFSKNYILIKGLSTAEARDFLAFYLCILKSFFVIVVRRVVILSAAVITVSVIIPLPVRIIALMIATICVKALIVVHVLIVVTVVIP